MSEGIGKELAGKVETKGIWGTYDDGLKFVRAGGLHSESSGGSSEDLAHQVESGLNRPSSSLSSASSDSTPSSADSGAVFGTPSSGSVTSSAADAPTHLMFLGSSLGNFSREDATSFLGSLPLRPASGDTLLIGLDHDNPKETIERAYNDKAGYTRKFILNGLKGAGRALGDETLFNEDNWDYTNVRHVFQPHATADLCLMQSYDPNSRETLPYTHGTA